MSFRTIVGDWESDGLEIVNYLQKPKPHDTYWVDVKGYVHDINAGHFFPDRWQLAVAIAVVNSDGTPTTLNMVSVIKENIATLIYIRDEFHTDMHLSVGPLPEFSVTIKIKLFANHNINPDFDWSAWAGSGSSGWDLIDTKSLEVIISDGGPGPEPKPEVNWALVGSTALFVAMIVIASKRRGQ